jgi:hypothetical protein
MSPVRSWPATNSYPYSLYLFGGAQAVLKTDERYASLEGAAMYAEEPILFLIERCIAEGKQKLSKEEQKRKREAEARGEVFHVDYEKVRCVSCVWIYDGYKSPSSVVGVASLCLSAWLQHISPSGVLVPYTR